MSPGGHLLTTTVACAGAAAATGSWPVTAAVAAGGFLIDIDHAVDYVLFEGQRDLRPGAFLRYYLDGRVRRAVLLLHSYEVLLLLGALAWSAGSEVLGGYLVGAVMHLVLDVIFNGELTPRSIVAFYSITYRAAHRFDAGVLIGDVPRRPTAGFWRGFFLGAQPDGQPSGRLPRAWSKSSAS